jgi:hypothetical protein
MYVVHANGNREKTGASLAYPVVMGLASAVAVDSKQTPDVAKIDPLRHWIRSLYH